MSQKLELNIGAEGKEFKVTISESGEQKGIVQATQLNPDEVILEDSNPKVLFSYKVAVKPFDGTPRFFRRSYSDTRLAAVDDAIALAEKHF